MFNLLKLLGSISSPSDKEKSAENPPATEPSAVKTTPTPPPPAERRNVMAEVIERHERISYRVKK